MTQPIGPPRVGPLSKGRNGGGKRGFAAQRDQFGAQGVGLRVAQFQGKDMRMGQIKGLGLHVPGLLCCTPIKINQGGSIARGMRGQQLCIQRVHQIIRQRGFHAPGARRPRGLQPIDGKDASARP